MAKQGDMRTITFRCPADVADDLKILARIDGCTVSDFIRALMTEFVTANKQRISKFKRAAAVPIKKSATFAAPTNNPPAAQDDDKGGDPQ